MLFLVLKFVVINLALGAARLITKFNIVVILLISFTNRLQFRLTSVGFTYVSYISLWENERVNYYCW